MSAETPQTPIVRGDGMTHTTVETWAKTGDVVDPQPIKKQYGTALYYPDRIEVWYQSTNGAPWEIQQIVLRGPGHTKAGRSKTARRADEFSSWSMRNAPKWALAWANDNLPEPHGGEPS